MEVSPPILAILTPVGYPVLFLFCRISFVFSFCRFSLLPWFLWPWGIALRPSDRQNTKNTGFPRSLTDGYATPWLPLPPDMAVRISEAIARPWVGVCVPLALIY